MVGEVAPRLHLSRGGVKPTSPPKKCVSIRAKNVYRGVFNSFEQILLVFEQSLAFLKSDFRLFCIHDFKPNAT